MSGANSLEMLWAIVGLGLIGIVGVISGIAWVALWVEGQLSQIPWSTSPVRMPGILLDLLTGGHAGVAATVGEPWRPGAVATILALAATWGAVRTMQAWGDWRSGWRHRQRARERIRSRTWARRRDLGALLLTPPAATAAEPPAEGRLLIGSVDGHDVLAPARTSVMVVAPTRTGKSTRLVVPNLLRWDGPAVVTSVKRDVYDLTVTRRAGVGAARLFDPTGSMGLPSVRWSPLLTSTTFADATKTATWLADAAAVEDKHEAAKFWETLATKLLAPMLFAAARTSRTMSDVSHWVDRSAFEEVAGILNQLGDEDATAAWQAIRELPNETRGSVFGTAMAIFRAFGSPRVRAATSCTPGDVADTLDIPGLLRDNGTLYLVSPEYEQAELRPVFVALVQAVYRTAVDVSANLLDGAPLSPPLLLMLDEAGNIAPLHTLPRIASTGAGQGITLMTIWQDRAQIRERYGDSERTVVSNHSTSVWLPGSQDLDTLKLLSDLIGDQWVASATVSTAPEGGLSVSEGSERMDVAPPAFLRTLPHGSAVMLTGNVPPALVTTHAYYEQRRWRRLVGEQVVTAHSAIHHGRGPTTAEQWKAKDWQAGLPAAPRPLDRGSLGRALQARYAPVVGDVRQRTTWGVVGAGIPDRLSSEPRRWGPVELPPTLAMHLGGQSSVDLRDPATREYVLPIWLEAGPADALERTITFPQLRAEWACLALPDDVREAWQACFPGLVDDASLTATHPLAR